VENTTGFQFWHRYCPCYAMSDGLKLWLGPAACYETSLKDGLLGSERGKASLFFVFFSRIMPF